MNISAYSLNQLPRTQDKNTLSGQKSINFTKNKTQFTAFKSHFITDETHTLPRVGILYEEYGCSERSFNYSTESRSGSGYSLTMLRAEHKVYSIEEN